MFFKDIRDVGRQIVCLGVYLLTTPCYLRLSAADLQYVIKLVSQNASFVNKSITGLNRQQRLGAFVFLSYVGFLSCKQNYNKTVVD